MNIANEIRLITAQLLKIASEMGPKTKRQRNLQQDKFLEDYVAKLFQDKRYAGKVVGDFEINKNYLWLLNRDDNEAIISVLKRNPEMQFKVYIKNKGYKTLDLILTKDPNYYGYFELTVD